MGKKLLAIVTFALLCFGSIVFATQSTNSRMTQINSFPGNNLNVNVGRHRRHRRHRHKKYRHRHMKMIKRNSNM